MHIVKLPGNYIELQSCKIDYYYLVFCNGFVAKGVRLIVDNGLICQPEHESNLSGKQTFPYWWGFTGGIT